MKENLDNTGNIKRKGTGLNNLMTTKTSFQSEKIFHYFIKKGKS